MSDTPLLSSLDLPGDIKRLSLDQKQALAQELRSTIIRTVTANGGHLAPSLGVVELTLALLSSFDASRDSIVWDVGHQSYPWKLLTGRADRFSTLRRYGGLSGFPNRSESPYDSFGVGHASTSISAALGMATARDLNGGNEHVVAVIGDGALSGGMAFEALNQACIVEVYTDSQYITKAITEGWLENWKKRGWKKADKSPVLNVDLWQRLDACFGKHEVHVHWVKGHADNPFNNRCDELAVAARLKF